jgi:putative iron-dependent peroxidase
VSDQALRDAIRAAHESGSESNARLVMAFGPAVWRHLVGDGAPSALHDFETLRGWQGHDAPARQRDLLFWIHGEGPDRVLDRGLAVQRALTSAAAQEIQLELEQPGFVYRDSRDLTGFIDGTANPQAEERFEVALVPDGEPGAGGSFVLTQRWLHDLAGWSGLSVSQQERVIGRTRADSVQLEGDAMPADSHVSRVEFEEDGVEVALYRRSFPHGGVAEHGLYFLAFSCDPHRFDVLLRRMFGLAGDGLHDALTGHSRPTSGAYWFAPSLEDLVAALA